ncbi:MAG: hypothetical protein VX265_17850 [Myxococcota bacterium]|nr:hypothetical protein [Myxococcota bacterium]
MRWLLGLMVSLSALAGSAARAECAGLYTGQQLAGDLGAASSALRAKDDAAFQAAGQRLDAGLPCLGAPVPAPVFAVAFRTVGLYHHRFGNKDRGRQWFLTGLELDASFEWDIAEVAPGDPVRQVFDDLRGEAEADRVMLTGQELAVPAGTRLVLDGRRLDEASATQGRPHVLQVVSAADNQVKQTLLVEGNALPERFLQTMVVADTASDNPPKKDKKAGHTPTDDLSVVKVRRVRPAAKTPLMVGGAVLALGAGGLYGSTFATRAKFDAATSTADLTRYRTLTNSLVIASAATLAVGLSVEYAGIMLGAAPGGAQVGLARRF